MDLVDEEHVARFQFGKDGRQISGPFQRRSGGDLQFGTHLSGHDVGQRGLAEARGTGEQEVVSGLAPLAGRSEHHPEVALELGLTDELVEAAGAEAHLEFHLDGFPIRREEFLAHACHPLRPGQSLEGFAQQHCCIVAGQVTEHRPDLLKGVAKATKRLLNLDEGRACPAGGLGPGGNPVDGHVEGAFEFDEQPGGGLLADPGNQAQSGYILVSDHPGQLKGPVHAEH